MAQMRIAHESGLPPMRPLFLDFPADPACWEVEDQFLLGGDMLVAPVVTEGARARGGVPAGRRAPGGMPGRGEAVPGGRWLTAPAPLETIPVYVREGGAVPPFDGLEPVRCCGE